MLGTSTFTLSFLFIFLFLLIVDRHITILNNNHCLTFTIIDLDKSASFVIDNFFYKKYTRCCFEQTTGCCISHSTTRLGGSLTVGVRLMDLLMQFCIKIHEARSYSPVVNDPHA